MQIKILSLYIKNSGALKDIIIDFTDNEQPQSVIVLAGANGSGKTTVLELIFACMGMVADSLTEKSLIPDIFLQTESVKLKCLFEDNNKQKIVHEVYYDKNQLGIAWELKDKTYEDLYKLRHEISMQTCIPYQKLSLLKEMMPCLIHFPYNRELIHVTGEQIYREDIKYEWCYRYQNHSDFKGSLESHLIWLDYAEPEQFYSIIKFLNQLDFEGKTFYVHRKTLSVRVKTRDGNEHPFNKLSSGEQNILIMLLDLRRRLIPGSIVLIDEIENSLHPAYQQRFAKNLLQLQQEIPFQLILTTHQAHFVKIFGEDCSRILTEF